MWKNLGSVLKRLKEQAEADYRRPWHPGVEKTDAEILWAYIQHLQEQRDDLQQERINYSWIMNPDRSGGAFTQDEIDRARGDSW